MGNIDETISNFQKNILVDLILSFIILFIILTIFCIVIVKFKSEKIKWIILLPLIWVSAHIIFLIPSFVDVYTDNIKTIEITDYIYRGNSGISYNLNPHGQKITFNTLDGNRDYGYFLKDSDIPKNGHGSILHAKYSHYILDYFILPNS